MFSIIKHPSCRFPYPICIVTNIIEECMYQQLFDSLQSLKEIRCKLHYTGNKKEKKILNSNHLITLKENH